MLTRFARCYAKAWCSQNPENVAVFFAENGSLTVNDGPPAVGRVAIAEVARGFMSTFPDMVVTFDKLEPQSNATAFQALENRSGAAPSQPAARVLGTCGRNPAPRLACLVCTARR